MSQSLQVVIMRATDLQSAIPGTLPAAQVELRAIYNDEEIAFHKTTVMFAQFVLCGQQPLVRTRNRRRGDATVCVIDKNLCVNRR